MGTFEPPDVGRLAAERDVPALLQALTEGDESVRCAAAVALGQVPDARAVEPLITALDDLGREVRRAATAALGEIGEARAVEPLIAALAVDDVVERLAAADALVRVGADAVEPLVARLTDYMVDARVRKAAADTLGRLGWQPDRSEAGAAYWAARGECRRCVEIGTPSVEPLAARLNDPRVDRRERVAVAEALGKIRGASAAAALVATLSVADKDVRKAAAQALIVVGAEALEPLVAALQDRDRGVDMRSEAASVLGRMGPPAVELVLAVLDDPDWFARASAVTALGRIGDPRAVKPLMAALNDKNEHVRRDAADALAELRVAPTGGPSAAPTYPNAFVVGPMARGLRDVDEAARRARLGLIREHLGITDAVEVPTATPSTSGHRDVFVANSSDCTDTHDDSVSGFWR